MLSNCCDAPKFMGCDESDICNACKEHAEFYDDSLCEHGIEEGCCSFCRARDYEEKFPSGVVEGETEILTLNLLLLKKQLDDYDRAHMEAMQAMRNIIDIFKEGAK